MSPKDWLPKAPDGASMDHEDLAAQAYIRRQFGPWTESDELILRDKLESNADYASAFGRVDQSWSEVGGQAATPELMELREQALARARRSSSRRWLVSALGDFKTIAAAASLLVVIVGGYQMAPFGLRPGEYRTEVGEQRVFELEDHSRIALDAATQVKVEYSNDARTVHLREGQAQFSVSRDPKRPFKVQVGEHTIVALGTKFTVEFIDSALTLAMSEGHVAVVSDSVAEATSLPQTSSANAATASGEEAGGYSRNAPAEVIELFAGEGLHVDRGGEPVRIKVDLKAINAWREGKVIFNDKPLQLAVRQLNRYSSLQIEISDPALAAMRVSGVFDAGDAFAFVEAVQASFPTTVDYSDSSTIRLRSRQ